MERWQEFSDFVSAMCTNLARLQETERKESEKNSLSTSDGD